MTPLTPTRHPVPFSVLALDPSTEITGAVVVQFADANAFGTPHRDTITERVRTHRMLFHASAWDAEHAEELGTLARRGDLQSAVARIRWTRGNLSRFVLSSEIPHFDVLAFEGHTGRGSGSPTLDMAFGAYLSLSHFVPYNPVMVTRQAACLATGTYAVYKEPAGKTTAEREAKKRRLKGAVLAWAMATYPALARLTHLSVPELEAIADALAVAEVVWVNEQKRRAAVEAKERLREDARAAKRVPKGGKA